MTRIDFSNMTRRSLLGSTGVSLGAMALDRLLKRSLGGETESLPHHMPRAKRIIYLCQSGAPSQQDLLDHKPKLEQMAGQQLPDSVRQGQRLTTMTSSQGSLPLLPSPYRFQQYGQSKMAISDLLPHTAQVADKLCLVRSMMTDAVNHDPALTLLLTGHQLPGRPSLGSWLSYGLGSESDELPSFVVLVSQGGSLANQQPLFHRLWANGFLPAQYQGVRFRSQGSPVLYLDNPPGITKQDRRAMLDVIGKLNHGQSSVVGDPEIEARTRQYELAFQMQTSVPSLVDISGEPKSVLESYGPNVRQPGTFAANCLIARRMAERGVRFIQLFHRGWDQHTHLKRDLPRQCADTDQPSAALICDLERLGMLEDTLVIWGGEFGRTSYCQGQISTKEAGRDHHGRCFSIWMAGGGVKAGHVHGATDELGYNVVRDPVHVHDLNATLLHLLGIDHEQLTYRFQSRDFRLTDIHGNVVTKILA